MKDIVWDRILSVGNDEIDRDHRILIDLFNTLHQSAVESVGTDYLDAILEELINCTVWHFSHEERLMQKYDYERYAEHRAEHQDLINSIKELQKKVRLSGELGSKENLEFLEHWLTEHILSADMKLGSFLAEVM